MPQVTLDQEICDYLASKTLVLQESPSSILRRLLGLPGRVPEKTAGLGDRDHRLVEFSASEGVRRKRTALERYFAIIGFVLRENEAEADRITSLNGRKRKFFARTEAEIEKSGTSTAPQLIPGTRYWALTNNDNRQKRTIIKELARRFDYSATAVDSAGRAVVSAST